MAVNLQKGVKVNLRKKGVSGIGEILVNLNWNSRPKNEGFFSKLFSSRSGIDLDLGCLFELEDGKIGAIQALGKSFGSLERPPYIALDGDDRTGDSSSGENLRINGKKIAEIKRILIYTYIYEGVANWQQADGTVTIKYPGEEDLIVKMDEYNSTEKMCALALLENVNDETFSVEKLIRFYRGHEAMDRDYHWGLKWVQGRK